MKIDHWLLKILYDVCKKLFRFFEIPEAEEEQDDADDERNGQEGPVDWSVTKKRTAGGGNDAGHRIKIGDPLESLGNDADRINYRGDKKQNLDKKGQGVADIAIFHIKRTEP